jgi:large conductance mechanosensitive channel
LILAFAIFLMVKQINRLKQSAAAAEPTAPPPVTPEEVLLLRDIRDQLQRRS